MPDNRLRGSKPLTFYFFNMEVINTSKKNDFIKAWGEKYPDFKSPKAFHEQKDYGAFAKLLNEAPEVHALFNEAVAEATADRDPAAGLSELFGWDK